MKTIAQIKKKLYCLKQGHMDQPIDYICAENQCTSEKLCCYICQSQDHKTHHMESIKMLLAKITEINNLNIEYLSTSATMDRIGIQIREFLQKCKHEFHDYDSIINSFKKYVEGRRNKVMRMFGFMQYLQTISNLAANDFQKEFVTFLEQNLYALIIEEKDEKEKQGENIYNYALKNQHAQFKQILKSLRHLEKQSRIDDFEVLSLFLIEVDDCNKSFKPYFSEFYKGPCMKITPTTAQMTTSSSQRILALQPCLQSGRKLKKWKVKITKLASWIGIGACHLNKLKEANWFFNYTNTQHGSYFISSNGYSWSSYKPEFNSKFQPFAFKTGDIIVVYFNIREKKLRFQKEGTIEKYAIDVQINGDPLYPAINLTGIGDSVQIIH